MIKPKQKRIKSIKGWATCCSIQGITRAYRDKDKCKDYIYEQNQANLGCKHKIIPVLITPLVVAKGDKKKK